MTQAEHEENLRRVEAETQEIKKQIMQLEFQHEKDSIELDKPIKQNHEQITKQIKYIAKIAGITYEELDNLDHKIQESGRHLVEPRRHSTIS